ncbi:MAG: hypothetical protein KC506_02855, partial [Nanoarchaeota archaeon]|nr:hypothetical protein [Nanoarchaeota archaeon]
MKKKTKKKNFKQKEKNIPSIIIITFLIATTFFLLQHHWDLDWDFSSYVINANYHFHGGDYVEIYRAPLASLILGPLLFLGKTGEFFYVVLVSVLFLISNLHLGKTLHSKYFKKFRLTEREFQIIFYLLSLNGFTIYFGTLVGTELLSLAFFELFLSFLLREKYSGQFLALAVLTRYNFLIFAPLMFLNKNIKKILINFALF